MDIGADLYEEILFHTSRGSRERIIESSDAKSFHTETTDRHTEEDFDVINMKMKNLAEDDKSYEDLTQPSIDTYDQRAVEQCRKIALYRAASFSDAETAKFMLDCDERGETINLRNNDWGETALFRATWNGHDAVVQYLRSVSAPRGACAMTLLDMATFEEHEAVVQQLLAAIEIIEDNKPGDSAEVKTSIPPFHSDPDNISEASQENFDFPQPLQPLTAATLETCGLKTLSHQTVSPIRAPVYRGLDTL